MKYKKKALFLSFEGPEASGKSTQIKLLKKFFLKNNIPFIITREPGGTPLAEKLRKIILSKKDKITTKEEIFLLMSARLNHINSVIMPALKKNKIVISDRYADSTFVYQGYYNNFMKETLFLHKTLLSNLLPNKTFLFLLSSREINKRLKNRNFKNKYDRINKSFHNKIISGYKKLSKNNKRFITINATHQQMDIHKKITNSIEKLLR